MSTQSKYTLKWLFFEFDGRIRRMTYFLSGVFFVLLYTYITAAIFQTPKSSALLGWLGLAFLGLMAVSLWATIALSVKRLHDLGFPGVMTVVMFIPMVSFLFFFALCLVPGNPGKNQYGSSPVMPDQ